ncbi:MAG TPA: endonuclease NucS domain-containing protein [Thermoguttaceae bacterium]|nr:endonuclease NucS domain-containing protein [Thermoguttaceae bacterium]
MSDHPCSETTSLLDDNRLTQALSRLRAILVTLDKDPELKGMVEARDAVIARYQEVFGPERLEHITEQEFRGFLLLKNNQHWSGLARKGTALCSDMARVREGLSILLDESCPLNNRLEELVPRGKPPFMKNFGKALITAILHVCHPDKYGVYNGTSEAGMLAVGAFPEFDRGSSFAERYIKINDTLLQLAARLQIDLWTLDGLWWRVKSHEGAQEDDDLQPLLADDQDSQAFGLERHLHNFIFDNWSSLPLAKHWNLHEEDGEVVGYEYNTNEIGKIDLLATHRAEPRWLVIELKREQTSDDTIGQVLRYMGWVKEHLASQNETVEGLVIARESDARIRYALMHTTNVAFMRYEVDFQLQVVPGLRGPQE